MNTKDVLRLILLICLTASATPADIGTNILRGPGSNYEPFLVPNRSDVTVYSLLSAGENELTFGGYFMTGTPDGLAAFDNGDGTFTVLMNHEIPFFSSIPLLFTNNQPVHSHGGKGAHVSRWIINKPDHPTAPFQIVSGDDLISAVNIWDKQNAKFVESDSENLQSLCSSTLSSASMFFNRETGKGTTTQIYTTGEELGNYVLYAFTPEGEEPTIYLDRSDGGRAFAVLLSGSHSGTAFELPRLGNMRFENVIPSPFEQDPTVVLLCDDSGPGQVYLYLGEKTTDGKTEIDKAGLNNGSLFGISITGKTDETVHAVASGDRFTLTDLGDVSMLDFDAVETLSNESMVTRFGRVEDGDWNTLNPNQFYFVTTGGIFNGITYPTRLWRFTLDSIENPTLGGVIDILIDGTDRPDLGGFDNISCDPRGDVWIQEDKDDSPLLSRVFRYVVQEDRLETIATHNPAYFSPGSPSLLSIDEESSGIVDVSHVLGEGWFLLTSMAHKRAVTLNDLFDNLDANSTYYEEGQLLAMFVDPDPPHASENPLPISLHNLGPFMDARFPTVPGQNYQLQFSMDLKNWFHVSHVVGTGYEHRFPYFSPDPTGFWRVGSEAD